MLVLDEGYQVHIVLTLDDEDALAGVTVGVRMLDDVEQVAALDVKDDVLESDAGVRPEPDFVGLRAHGACVPRSPGRRARRTRAFKRKRICRTFSDCTTGPRLGLVSGCYPLIPST